MTSFVVFQLLTLSLLLTQSFIAPLFLGVGEFGRQMLVLSPAFLLQAIVEPAYQNAYNSVKDQHVFCWFDAFILIVLFAVFLFALEQLDVPVFRFDLIFFFMLYQFYTAYVAELHSRFAVELLTRNALILLVAYCISFLVFLILNPTNAIILSNVSAFFASVVFLMLKSPMKYRLTGSVLLSDGVKSINGFLYRLPSIVFSSGVILALGILGACASTIGSTRIFISAINFGKYANLTPVATAQMAISQSFFDRLPLYRSRVLITYAICILIFSILFTLLSPFLFIVIFNTYIDISAVGIFFCCLLLLIQPLAYCCNVMPIRYGFSAYTVHFSISFIVSAAFLLAFHLTDLAVFSLMISISLTCLLYVITLWQLTKVEL